MHSTTDSPLGATRPRVLLLIDRLEDGGAERQFCELAKGLARSGRFEVTVGVVDGRPGVYEWALEGLPVARRCFERRKRLRPAPLLRLLREVRRDRYDLVHAYKPLACDYAAFVRILRGVPVVLSSIRNGQDRDRKQYWRTRFHARVGDLLLANSRAGLDSRFPKLEPHFAVVRNGIDLDRLRLPADVRDRARRAWSLPTQAPLLVMAASFTPKKDHETLLLAMRQVVDQRPDVQLAFAGQGPTLPQIEQQARALRLADHVHFLGFVERSEELLAAADLSLLLTNTRVHGEGMSNTLLESMGLGTPTIATRGGGTAELVDDGRDGVLVPPRDPDAVAAAILRLLGEPAECRRLGEHAREKVAREYSLQHFVEENVRLYEKLLGSSPA